MLPESQVPEEVGTPTASLYKSQAWKHEMKIDTDKAKPATKSHLHYKVPCLLQQSERREINVRVHQHQFLPRRHQTLGREGDIHGERNMQGERIPIY